MSERTTTTDMSDEALWEAAAGRGDQRAFEQLFLRHRPMALRVAGRICGSEAEDVVQVAFTAIWNNRASFDPTKGSVKTWMMTVVRNRAIDLTRSAVRRREGTSAYPFWETPDPVRTEELAADRETSIELRKAVAGLPNAQRTVVELGYFGEMSQSEIAKKLGVPLGTVKGRARAALKNLAPAVDGSVAAPVAAAA